MVILIRDTGCPTGWVSGTYGRKHEIPIDLALRLPSKSRLGRKTKVQSSYAEPAYKCHQPHVRLEQDVISRYRACGGKKRHRPGSYRTLGLFPLLTWKVTHRHHRLPERENFRAFLGYRNGS